jgi:uncharacterized protein (TIGR02186 family)
MKRTAPPAPLDASPLAGRNTAGARGHTIKGLSLLFALTVTALLAAARPAAAERLISSLSNHRVMVTSNFTGDEVVLFGGIEQDANSKPRRGGYDIVVTVTGPRQTLVTFRKSRVLGIWVNTEASVFEKAPAYLAVLSNRPLDDITSADTLQRLHLGLDNFPLPQRGDAGYADGTYDDSFRAAFVKIRTDLHLYRQVSNGVTFLTPALFRASIPLPAAVPVGNYDVDVRLFADGAMIARTPSALEVYKAGFEQVVSNAARYHGFLYGIGTAMMAIVTGWFASVVFRRD